MSTKLKVGDIVTLIEDCSGVMTGKAYMIQEDRSGKYVQDERSHVCQCINNWKLLKETLVIRTFNSNSIVRI